MLPIFPLDREASASVQDGRRKKQTLIRFSLPAGLDAISTPRKKRRVDVAEEARSAQSEPTIESESSAVATEPAAAVHEGSGVDERQAIRQFPLVQKQSSGIHQASRNQDASMSTENSFCLKWEEAILFGAPSESSERIATKGLTKQKLRYSNVFFQHPFGSCAELKEAVPIKQEAALEGSCVGAAAGTLSPIHFPQPVPKDSAVEKALRIVCTVASLDINRVLFYPRKLQAAIPVVVQAAEAGKGGQSHTNEKPAATEGGNTTSVSRVSDAEEEDVTLGSLYVMIQGMLCEYNDLMASLHSTGGSYGSAQRHADHHQRALQSLFFLEKRASSALQCLEWTLVSCLAALMNGVLKDKLRQSTSSLSYDLNTLTQPLSAFSYATNILVRLPAVLETEEWPHLLSEGLIQQHVSTILSGPHRQAAAAATQNAGVSVPSAASVGVASTHAVKQEQGARKEAMGDGRELSLRGVRAAVISVGVDSLSNLKLEHDVSGVLNDDFGLGGGRGSHSSGKHALLFGSSSTSANGNPEIAGAVPASAESGHSSLKDGRNGCLSTFSGILSSVFHRNCCDDDSEDDGVMSIAVAMELLFEFRLARLPPLPALHSLLKGPLVARIIEEKEYLREVGGSMGTDEAEATTSTANSAGPDDLQRAIETLSNKICAEWNDLLFQSVSAYGWRSTDTSVRSSISSPEGSLCVSCTSVLLAAVREMYPHAFALPLSGGTDPHDVAASKHRSGNGSERSALQAFVVVEYWFRVLAVRAQWRRVLRETMRTSVARIVSSHSSVTKSSAVHFERSAGKQYLGNELNHYFQSALSFSCITAQTASASPSAAALRSEDAKRSVAQRCLSVLNTLRSMDHQGWFWFPVFDQGNMDFLSFEEWIRSPSFAMKNRQEAFTGMRQVLEGMVNNCVTRYGPTNEFSVTITQLRRAFVDVAKAEGLL